MDIVNKDELDQFLWDHRDNGCVSLKGSDGVNAAWQDKVTKETIDIIYSPTIQED